MYTIAGAPGGAREYMIADPACRKLIDRVLPREYLSACTQSKNDTNRVKALEYMAKESRTGVIDAAAINKFVENRDTVLKDG